MSRLITAASAALIMGLGAMPFLEPRPMRRRAQHLRKSRPIKFKYRQRSKGRWGKQYVLKGVRP